MEAVTGFLSLGSNITEDSDCSHETRRRLLFVRKAMANLDSILKNKDITLPGNVSIVEAMVFPVIIWMFELDRKESWVLKKWCYQTVVLEKTLESPLDCKEIQPVHSEGGQPWIFIGRTDAEAEIPVLWLLDVKYQLTGKDPSAEKYWRQ